jgi:hypothetical protein
MVNLVNGYGISETTVYSTFKEVTASELRQPTGSIGTPLQGTYIYILSPDRQLCPIGVVGEIFIGGLGVGRGYNRQPDLTKARYVSDPFDPERIVYRSGDLARWLPDGEIEYLGRSDTQVKVRGHRIEIAGLESILAAHPAVREAVVAPKQLLNFNTQLWAFFTAHGPVDAAEVRYHLAGQVPSFMVPARFIRVDAIPVTPNGKVDRQRLLAMEDRKEPAPEAADVAGLQRIIAEAWAGVLGLELSDIGQDQSFFDIGGDSISANLVVRILSSKGYDVEIADVFEATTIIRLSETIIRKSGHTAQDGNRQEYLFSPGVGDPAASTVDKRDGRWHQFALAGGPGGDACQRDRRLLLAAMLSSLGMALRMATGTRFVRVMLHGHPDMDTSPRRRTIGEGVTIALDIGDINRSDQILETTLMRLREAASNRFAHQATTAASGSAGCDVELLFADSSESDAASFSQTRTEMAATPKGVLQLIAVGDGLKVDVEVLNRSQEFRSLELLWENWEFALRQVLAAAPVPAQAGDVVKARVQPVNDFYFKDCTSHALLSAFAYFGGDVRLLLANTTANCAIDERATRELQVQNQFYTFLPEKELLRRGGLAVESIASCGNVLETLCQTLSSGSLGIVKLDCFWVQRKKELFQKRHGEHSILVTGFDRSSRTFHALDSEGFDEALYRPITIGFMELEAAYAGYNELFNSLASGTSLLTVGANECVEHEIEQVNFCRLALQSFARFLPERLAGREALLRLRDNFKIIGADQRSLLGSIVAFNYAIGNLLAARRLEDYTLRTIVRDSELSELSAAITDHFALIRNLLTKMQISTRFDAIKVHTIAERLSEIVELEPKLIDRLVSMIGA